ncbi:MAG TPA: ribosome small subunit-dependent GTPase A [Candidatus Paceibacterota bacterium]
MISETKNITARVTAENKKDYSVKAADGSEFLATVRGKFHLDEEYPKVGDYVECSVIQEGKRELAVIEKILPRKTVIARDVTERSRTKHAAAQKMQVIVTNVDIMFIVMGLDGDFSISRLERYLALAKQSGIKPVIILNKSDVVGDRSVFEQKVRVVAEGVALHFISATKGEGMGGLLGHIGQETTAVLLGSSGAGKSTITNALLGTDSQATGGVREEDSRGRHTTTRRELFALPTGGYLIDTPGIRSLGMAETEEQSAESFEDIVALAAQCRFTKCDHQKSEGCAIQEAIRSGEIDPAHFESYLKLKSEEEFRAAKADAKSQADHKQKVRNLHKKYHKIQDEKYKGRGFR